MIMLKEPLSLCNVDYTPSQSFFLTLATAASIAFSLGLAYALYTLVLRIKFFPFMNILASVIAVGKKGLSVVLKA